MQKHSGLGITSFIMSIAVGLFVIKCFILWVTWMTFDTPIVLAIMGAAVITTDDLAFLPAGILAITAIVVGVAGIAKNNQKNAFSLIGIFFSATTILVSNFLWGARILFFLIVYGWQFF